MTQTPDAHPPVTTPARTPLPMTYEDVATLAAALSADDFRLAVRIVSYYAAFGQGMPENIATTFLGISRRKWEKAATVLRPFFDTTHGRWTLPSSRSLSSTLLPTTSWAGEDALGMRTLHASLPLGVPASSTTLPLLVAGIKPAQPTRATETAPKAPSLTQHIFKAGVALLISAGRTEIQSRQCIARLLKDWNDGDVAEAIDAALKQEPIDPYSWMRARLKAIAQKRGSTQLSSTTPPPSSRPIVRPARPIASPDFLGVSEGMVAKIRAASARHRGVSPSFSEKSKEEDIK